MLRQRAIRNDVQRRLSTPPRRRGIDADRRTINRSDTDSSLFRRTTRPHQSHSNAISPRTCNPQIRERAVTQRQPIREVMPQRRPLLLRLLDAVDCVARLLRGQRRCFHGHSLAVVPVRHECREGDESGVVQMHRPDRRALVRISQRDQDVDFDGFSKGDFLVGLI